MLLLERHQHGRIHARTTVRTRGSTNLILRAGRRPGQSCDTGDEHATVLRGPTSDSQYPEIETSSTGGALPLRYAGSAHDDDSATLCCARRRRYRCRIRPGSCRSCHEIPASVTGHFTRRGIRMPYVAQSYLREARRL